MERISRFRAMVLLIIFCLILVLFASRLFYLQIIDTEGNTDNTTVYTSLTRVKAARGDILDRNGNILVGNRASYDLVINHYVIESADNRNEHLNRLLKKCQELGIEYTDHFPVTPTRPFEYTLDDYTAAWRNYFQSFLRSISLDSDITAPLLLQTLRDRYKIPTTWTDEEARAVIGLRYEFDLRGVAPLSNYVFIQDVSDEHLSVLLELNIPGLMVESSTVREYHTKYAAHILGYVGAMTDTQWTEYEKQGYAMDAYIGQDGFEAAFEEYLHASDGTRIDRVDKNGTIISQEYKEGFEPKAGNNVETTLDLNLQIVAEDALENIIDYLVNEDNDPNKNMEATGHDVEGAAVVVMNMTGEVLACASYPTFDLANMKDPEVYEQILEADFDPMYNRALDAIYYPGSSFKMCTLVAAMESGVYEYGEIIEDMGVFTKYAGFNPKCLVFSSYGITHGPIDHAKALEVSCNYFFYELGDRMYTKGFPDAQQDTAKALGLGVPTGIELDENIGHVANAESKKLYYTGYDAGFYIGDRIQSAIGQSENRFTPLQLCVYATTLANQGTRYKATFLNRVVSADYSELVLENSPKIANQLEISDTTYKAYLEGMTAVISGSQGTARKTMAGLDYQVAAKTGTAQTGMVGSDHGAFVCFAPADNPEIAIAVYGEKAAHGATLGRVAKEILSVYFDSDDTGEGAVISYENTLG